MICILGLRASFPHHVYCTVMLREAVSYSLERNGNMYCCLLDVSKAFDRIHYGRLFSIVFYKNMSPFAC